MGAAYGVLVLCFQEGWGESLLLYPPKWLEWLPEPQSEGAPPVPGAEPDAPAQPGVA